MFGVIDTSSKEVKKVILVSRVLEFKSNGKYVNYRRLKGGDTEYECFIRAPSEVFIEPVVPLFIPKNITHYILIELENPISIPADSKIEGYTIIPVDIAVFSIKNDNYKMVDVFSESKVKYALYGPKDEGIIARYYKSRFHISLRKPKDYMEAPLPLDITNSYNNWVKLRYILLDGTMLHLYYRPGDGTTYTRKIRIMITSETTATIDYERKGLVEGFREARQPLRLGVFMHVPRKTEMMWGI